MNKAEARKVYLRKRQELTEANWQSASASICNRFFASIDLSFVKRVHTYLPIEGRKEPDTWLIIDKIRREHPHVRLVVPKIDKGQLSHFFFEGLHQIKISTWGIPEPTQGVPADPSDLDLIIVPLLVADKAGHRVGYGKGFYDRFLNQCPPSTRKVGLALFPAIERISDIEAHDVRLDGLVTPDSYQEFK